MAHNATDTEVTQSNSGQKTTITAFKRRDPLYMSPSRQYAVAVISPMQKNDSSEPVCVDDRSVETSPAHPSRTFEQTFIRERESRHARTRQWRATHYPLTVFRPFSFDERDAARRVERERRLKTLRLMQDLQCVTFQTHPVRSSRPLQPPTHFKGPTQQ